MKAMILAAGKGERMKPLTNEIPKPLLKVGTLPLIVHHIKNLARANIREIVINLGHLPEKIPNELMNGHQFGVEIQYSYEDPILETGGAILKALNSAFLDNNPFLVISGDIYTDFPFEKLVAQPKTLAHLVMVDNPPHHLKGDYSLHEGFVVPKNEKTFNFAGIGVYRPELFTDCPGEKFPLPILFERSLKDRQITGEHYQGIWYNIGTPEQLKYVNERFA